MVQGVDSGVLHADSQTDGVQLCPSLRISLSPENCLVQGSRTVQFGSVSQCLGPQLGRLEDQELVCGWDLGTSGGFCSHVWELMLFVGCGLIWTVGKNTYTVASSYDISFQSGPHSMVGGFQELPAQERMRQKCLAFYGLVLEVTYHQFGYTLVVKESQRRDPIN